MRSIMGILERVKLILPVLTGKSVVITTTGNSVIVDAGLKNADDLKNIATVFFKTAYNLS